MQSFEAPFLTFTNAPDEPEYLGDEAELAALHRRVEALDEALRTGKNFDIVLDMLEEDGQDAAAYVEYVGENLEIIIASHLVPDDWNLWRRDLIK
jgi:hypothetical protein